MARAAIFCQGRSGKAVANKDNRISGAAARGIYVPAAETTRSRRGGYNAGHDAPAVSGYHRSTVIVLNILCDSGHRFDGWFASSDAFRAQCQRQLVQCPHCQSTAVSQLPSAPHVRRGATAEPGGEARAPTLPAAPSTQLFQALAQLARQAENVGERFPEEARRIHYDEAPARNIRGQASADETLELLEEGIFVLPAPVPHEDEFH